MKQSSLQTDQDIGSASQWRLIWHKFTRHKLALVGSVLLILLYLGAIFSEFLAPYAVDEGRSEYVYSPPQKMHLLDAEGRFHFRPFVYALKFERDPKTLVRQFYEDKSETYPVRLFVRGDAYKFWGLFRTDIHLFGAPGATIFVLGTDRMGRDILSRVIYASRISLSIGLVGVALSFVIGCVLGGLSGYVGGTVDLVIQRVIEYILSIPVLPMWMALSAALPPDWPPLRVYFGITVILSFLGWTGLARVVRGKLLQLREEDYVMAARIAGATGPRIVSRHLLPSFMSYLIVHLTLAIPAMILGETSLSFLGLGLRAPVVSWGVLLQDAQSVQSVILYPWLLIPGGFVVITVIAFNFVGDALRDAADPYS